MQDFDSAVVGTMATITQFLSFLINFVIITPNSNVSVIITKYELCMIIPILLYLIINHYYVITIASLLN